MTSKGDEFVMGPDSPTFFETETIDKEWLQKEFQKLHERIDQIEKIANRMELKADKLGNQVRGVVDKVC